MARRRRGGLSDAVYAGLYFLHGQIAAHGRRFASRRDKGDSRPDPEAWWDALERAEGEALQQRLIAYFTRYHFLGVIPNVNLALCAWLRVAWRLCLWERIPSSAQMLRMQAQGWRAVTVLAGEARAQRPVLDKPDALAFMVHDLEHAYKFFHDPALQAGQMRFFGAVERLIASGELQGYCADPLFAAKFEYLIADMNTHPAHSLHYLNAILIEARLRRAGLAPQAALPRADAAEIAAIVQAVADDVRRNEPLRTGGLIHSAAISHGPA